MCLRGMTGGDNVTMVKPSALSIIRDWKAGRDLNELLVDPEMEDTMLSVTRILSYIKEGGKWIAFVEGDRNDKRRTALARKCRKEIEADSF